MACDLCGKRGVALESLRDVYKTDDVSDVCHDCEKTVNKPLRKVQSFAFDLIPKLMKQYFKAFKPEPITDKGVK